MVPPPQANWGFPNHWVSTDTLDLKGKDLSPLSDPSIFEKFSSGLFNPDLLVSEDILSYLGLSPGEKDEKFDIGTFYFFCSFRFALLNF